MSSSLILRCGDRVLALPMGGVIEVFRMVAMATRLPRAPRYCLGVVDCHGRLLPVFDLAARLGVLPPRSERALVHGHVVVVKSGGEIGLAVEEAGELNDTPTQALTSDASLAPGRLTAAAVRCSDGRLAPLLDDGALLTVLARRQLEVALAALASA